MKTNTKKFFLPFATVALLAVGCADAGVEDAPTDSENASFGGNGKADHLFSQCEQSEVLQLLNESTSDPDHLVSLGVNRRAANGVWKHRLGPDGILGTADDDIFDDFHEFDDVPFVGIATLNQAVDAIVERCHESIRNRPFVNRKTFENSSGFGGRDNQEIEAAMTVSGITGQRLDAILRSTDNRGRTIFSRLRRNRDMEGLTYDYPIDEVPWKNGTMDVRESLSYVALSIESGRFDVDPDDDDGTRELSVGTDTMDDTYYDVANFNLLNAEMTVRGRVRWDTDTDVRRLLIAAKFGGDVDDSGLKRASKIDVRTEGGRHLSTLDNDVMAGAVPWFGSRATPIDPIEAVYNKCVELNLLPDMQGEADVLLMNPKVHMRSVRSRFHMNEASINGIERYHVNGRDRIADVNALIEARLAELPAADRDDAQALLDLGNRILSGEEIEARVGTVETPRPDEFFPVDTIEKLEENKRVAEAMFDAMHDYAELLDDLDNSLAGADGLRTDDEFAEMFILWRKSVKTSLLRKTIARPFLQEHDELSADIDQALADFNAFGEEQLAAENDDFEDFETVTAEMFADIKNYLTDEDLGDSHRMIATAGIMANALWFDLAREFYVPNSSRNSFSNFIIDTTDFTQMVTNEEWDSIPEDQRNPATELDPAKVFHSMLVNEVQIELGSEEPYVERIAELTEVFENDPTAENEAMLIGAKFVFDEYRNALTTIAAVKGDDIVDRLEDEGGPADMAWGPSEAAKGTTALRIISEGVRHR